MDEMTAVFPQVVRQLEAAFGKNKAFIDQVRHAQVVRVTFDAETNAGYIYVRAGRELNAVERNIIGVKHGQTIEVPADLWMNIDLDNFERLMGVEILTPPSEMAAHLSDQSHRRL